MNSELKKSAQNGLYEFAPDGNGCRIYHAETPRYWYNYCGCYTIATQNASYANSFPDKSFCIGSFFHHSCEPICVLT